jgi:hypothetical protein
LKDWEELNVEAVTGIRKKLYKRSWYFFCFDMNICLYSDLFNCSQNAGVITEDIAKPTLTAQAKERAREELLGRTGETDSEMEQD